MAGTGKFRGGKANLSFESWNREARNTSLQAPVQYGPSLSDRGGIGFLHKVESSFYKVSTSGEGLAKALDDRLRKRKAYKELIDLRSTFASEDDARDLFAAWRIDSPDATEQKVFVESFFRESRVDELDAVGKRSAAVFLINNILQKSREPLNQGDIRKSMAFGRLPTGIRVEASKGMRGASKKWLLLQVRQAQRLAIESLLAWVEHRILNVGERQSKQLVDALISNLKKHAPKLFAFNTPAETVESWLGQFKTLDEYINAALKTPAEFCIFTLCEELEAAVRGDSEKICLPAFKLLFLIRRFHDWLSQEDEVRGYLSLGHAERISIGFWAKTFDKNSSYEFPNLVALILNNMVLSQHFAVATNRFDGGTQRLRITIEEEGLEVLVSKPWMPDITPDRLGTVLSLMAECKLIKWDSDQSVYSI
jgi:hypothetical protein